MDRRKQGMLSYFLGRKAEEEACVFLQKKGFRLECKNFHSARGCGANELDLVMWDKKTLVFIEVKKRQSLEQAAQVVDARLQQRLFRGAEAFLSKNPSYANNDCRFDVVLIVPDNQPVHLMDVITG